mmetsp:Transcript_1453/g.2149  ORF Transcript_1453/g.2149 Transcript_1453/m.2149 type:complete len:444 (-) Transcript_1453:45-1376(-)
MIDPSWRIAAESLMPSLASGSVGSGGGIVQLSDTQKALNIPPSLVYICGLAIGNSCKSRAKCRQMERSPSFTKEQASFFQHLQELYQKEMTTQLRIYQMSPTLFPSDEMQMIVLKDVKRVEKELSEQASKEARKLLAGLPQQRQSNKACSKPKIKKVTLQRENIQNIPPHNEESHTLNVLNTSKTLGTDFISENVLCSDEDDAEWTEVKTKTVSQPCLNFQTESKENNGKERHGSKRKNQHGKEQDTAGTSPPNNAKYYVNEIKKVVLKKDHDYAVANIANFPLKYNLTMENPKTDKNLEMLRSSLKDNHGVYSSIISNDEIEYCNEIETVQTASIGQASLHEMVENLQIELRRKDQQLQMARNAHSKEIQVAEEKWQERIQALQLRLYISETRLKVHEDALAQHVDLVTKNTAKGNVGVRNTDEEIAPAPLFSRTAKSRTKL